MNNFIFFVLSFIPWCKTNVSMDSLSESYSYFIYESGGIVRQGVISDNKVKEVFLEKSSNLSDWSYDIKSYAPKIKFTSELSSISCNESGVISFNKLNENKDSFQLSKSDVALCDTLYFLIKNRQA
ncbi:hypothetical protein [Serratia silvae]|uniref:Lipoprotein n=1 Tax=Serratia silvae TaxID=2824122 RepID=A0ABT0KE13_9GAMM|nr:hypothetical protein [Serratia silvae]MCL1030037.1 hypothetical protein [Serratia silvae]